MLRFSKRVMHTVTEQSDAGLMDLLREAGSLGIAELAAAMHVTATAIRQRLVRLMAEGLIERDLAKTSRGRPSHRYRLTEKGIRQSGSNFADLAIALWQEIRQIKDPEVRSGLLRRIAQAMAGTYGGKVSGRTTAERMEGVRQLLAERKVPFVVEEKSGQLPVLTALACPYPTLAEQDRGICAVEKMLFTELLGTPVRLTECRLDGTSSCCRFQTS